MSKKRSSTEPVYPLKKRALLAQWQLDNQSNIHDQQNGLVNNLSGYHRNEGWVPNYQKNVEEEHSSGIDLSMSGMDKQTDDLLMVKKTSPNSDQSPPSYKTPERTPLSGRNHLKQISKPLFPPCSMEKQSTKDSVNVKHNRIDDSKFVENEKENNTVADRSNTVLMPSNSGIDFQCTNSHRIDSYSYSNVDNLSLGSSNLVKYGKPFLDVSEQHYLTTGLPSVMLLKKQNFERVPSKVDKENSELVPTSVSNQKFEFVASKVDNQKSEDAITMNKMSDSGQSLFIQGSEKKLECENLNSGKSLNSLKTDIHKNLTSFLQESSSNEHLNVHVQNGQKSSSDQVRNIHMPNNSKSSSNQSMNIQRQNNQESSSHQAFNITGQKSPKGSSKQTLNILGQKSPKSSSKQTLNVLRQNSPTFNSNTEHSEESSKVTMVDTNSRNYMCKVCDQELKSLGDLNVHMKQHRDSITCWKCGDNFNNAEKLCLHMKLEHDGENPYKCDTCGREFTQYNNLRRHLRVHRENLYKCNLCDREFNEKFYLRMHMSTHTGNRVYSCGICRAEFPSNHDLKMHVKSHSPSLLHTCSVCGKSFSKACVLRQHKKCHSGDRPHKCTICVKTFIHRHHLTMHLKSHNDDEKKQSKVSKETGDHSKSIADASCADQLNKSVTDFDTESKNKENQNPVSKRKEKSPRVKNSKRNLSEQFLHQSVNTKLSLQENTKVFHVPRVVKYSKDSEVTELTSKSGVQNFEKRKENPIYKDNKANHYSFHGNSLMHNISPPGKTFYSGSPLPPMFLSTSVSPYLNYYNQYAGQLQLYMNNMFMMNYLNGNLPHSYQGQGHLLDQGHTKSQGLPKGHGEFHSKGQGEPQPKGCTENLSRSHGDSYSHGQCEGHSKVQVEGCSNLKGQSEGHFYDQGQGHCYLDKNIECKKLPSSLIDLMKNKPDSKNSGTVLCENKSFMNCNISTNDKAEARIKHFKDESSQDSENYLGNNMVYLNLKQDLPNSVDHDEKHVKYHDIRVDDLKVIEKSRRVIETSPKHLNVVNVPDIDIEAAKEMIKLSEGLRPINGDNISVEH